jgi:hypothetical protein
MIAHTQLRLSQRESQAQLVPDTQPDTQPSEAIHNTYHLVIVAQRI